MDYYGSMLENQFFHIAPLTLFNTVVNKKRLNYNKNITIAWKDPHDQNEMFNCSHQ